MKQKKRFYTAEFKEQAVELWETTEKSQADVERELGISQGFVAKWKRKQKMEFEEIILGNANGNNNFAWK